MKKILSRLFDHHKLSEEEARSILIDISHGKYNAAQVASFITVFLMRNITVDELAGFRKALLDLCIRVDLEDRPTIDLCGTGGDGKNTFNISTLSSFVVAGAGYQVAKHGNYGVSSACGSSNVLEKIGYKFTNNADILKKQIDESNICFFHAPLFHPALKGVGPIRRELGMKTFFNMLGPLVNPAQPKHQIVGVYNLQIAKLYHYLHQNLDKSYAILHALDGYDEISLTGAVKIITNDSEQVYNPEDLGFQRLEPESIFGGKTVEEATDLFKKIISGQGTDAQNSVIIANSAIAIQRFKPYSSFDDCKEEAKESLLGNKAYQSLKSLIENQ
jgi:anthranilate phosphoribosyltransferase